MNSRTAKVALMLSVMFLGVAFAASGADAIRQKVCGRDYCVTDQSTCWDNWCRFLGNGLGYSCEIKYRGDGSSCTGGTCYNGACISNTPPTVTASGPSSVGVTQVGTFSVTASTTAGKGISRITLNVNGAQAGVCNPPSAPGATICTNECFKYCGRTTLITCCGWYTVCYSDYPNPYTCSFGYSPTSAGTYSYYGSATDTLSKTGTSSTKTFTATSLCNNNGVCDSGETSSSCSTDCLSDSGFTMSIDPTKGLANKGDVKVTNVSLTLVSGSGSAAFSATGMPAGTTASFSPTNCSPSCYSNATITTTATTPTGSHLISIKATSGSVVKTATYNLTILGTSATCGNLVCDYPETQSTCAADCATTADIPSPVTPGEVVTVTVEFRDFRYIANGKVKIDLLINPEGTAWTPANGCFFGGKKMGPTAGGGAIAWPPGTISEDGHFKIETSCIVPGTISAGAHTLVATPTIF